MFLFSFAKPGSPSSHTRPLCSKGNIGFVSSSIRPFTSSGSRHCTLSALSQPPGTQLASGWGKQFSWERACPAWVESWVGSPGLRRGRQDDQRFKVILDSLRLAWIASDFCFQRKRGRGRERGWGERERKRDWKKTEKHVTEHLFLANYRCRWNASWNPCPLPPSEPEKSCICLFPSPTEGNLLKIWLR